ncbi:GDSL esterase/lipase At1g28590-like [Vicia villosa]|uniref:GDSL esterase/lipase At1g28590-like n=1 Tax=Vicia villosa TaxID=3911 RepID=UPI00273C70E8|nr:GDSL esterase/lipase At1g28590-like [Vicia villosa]
MRLLSLFLLIAASAPLFTAAACPSYSSIFSFGDSLTDTGNLFYSSSDPSNHCFFPPYGQTYFHQPSGRCSDGRLIIDFIAELLGIPMVKPYLGIKNGVLEDNAAKDGVNFAVIGATALNVSYFEGRDVHNVATNYSLTVQLNWFKELLPTLCKSSERCHDILTNSLFLVGEIGGNDLNFPLFVRKSIEEVKTYVPDVINVIASSINELINLGARTLLVPGNFPLGCNTIYLTKYETKDSNQYDSFGCLKWLNEFAKFYNQKLQYEIHRLRKIHPHTNIIYGDYYNAALPLYRYPSKFGFLGLKACCGMGGSYNFNGLKPCGKPGVVACDDPSQYIGWDGIHLTEAAYKLIADGIINGPYSFPQFSNLCFMNVSYGNLNS